MIDDIEDLKKKMKRLGFKWQELRGREYEPGIFYKRIETKRPCTYNNKDQLVYEVVDQWALDVPESLRSSFKERFSLTAKVTGEFMVDFSPQWSSLSIYNLSVDDVLAHHASIEKALTRAWEALA